MMNTPDFPHCVYMETSVRCNAQCIICPSPYLRRPDLPLEVAKSVIDQCVGHPVEELHPFMYADPLVWPHLIELLCYAKDRMPGIKNILFTNAGLLGPETAQALIELELEWLTFSIDGTTSEVYEAHRVGLKFDEVMSNVFRFLDMNEAAGHPVKVRVHFTITRGNAHQLNDFLAFWTGKVDWVTFLNCDSRFERVMDRLGVEGERRYTSSPSLTEPCAQPFLGLYTLSDGKVGMCCLDYEPYQDLGNVKEQTVEEIWHGEPLRRVRELHNTGRKGEMEICRTCSQKN